MSKLRKKLGKVKMTFDMEQNDEPNDISDDLIYAEDLNGKKVPIGFYASEKLNLPGFRETVIKMLENGDFMKIGETGTTYESDIGKKENKTKQSTEATDSEVRDFLNGNNSLCKELSGFVNMKEHGVSYEEGLKMPLSARGFAIQSLMENRILEERLKNPHVGCCVGDNGRIICEFPPLFE